LAIGAAGALYWQFATTFCDSHVHANDTAKLDLLPRMKRTLVYFGHVPAEGAGSAIIVYRHLKRFKANDWDVRVVADWGQSDEYCREHGWPVLTLSHRKKYWPPFNPDNPISRALRAWLWAGEVREWLGNTQPHAVFTYLSAFSDTLSIAAAGFARRYGLPLATIVHDDCRCFTPLAEEGNKAHRRRQWILEKSTKGWFASPALAACFQLPQDKVALLPPIPEGAVAADADAFKPESDGSALLIYAGNYWPPQIPVLVDLAPVVKQGGGRLLAILKEKPETVATLRAGGVEWRAPYPKNTEALDYFREHASAMVVSYARTSDDMPWTRTSFPSKLIEYCHLGLPLVVIAPEDTAVVQWARSRNFPDVFLPSDHAGIREYVTRLRDPEFRRQRAKISLSFARGEFNPETIQKQLESSLS
jgi:hypothetical protein